MPSRIQLEQLVIHDMRKPGYGMPVGQIVAGKCPTDRVRAEAILYVRIADDVCIIIHGEERMMMHWQVNDQGNNCQYRGQKPRPLSKRAQQVLRRRGNWAGVPRGLTLGFPFGSARAHTGFLNSTILSAGGLPFVAAVNHEVRYPDRLRSGLAPTFSFLSETSACPVRPIGEYEEVSYSLICFRRTAGDLRFHRLRPDSGGRRALHFRRLLQLPACGRIAGQAEPPGP